MRTVYDVRLGWCFALARFLLSLGETTNLPACVKAVAEWFPKRQPGSRFARWRERTSRKSTSTRASGQRKAPRFSRWGWGSWPWAPRSFRELELHPVGDEKLRRRCRR